MSASQPDTTGYQQRVRSALHTHWVLFLIEGILLLVFGALAIMLPVVATLATTLVFGWLFLISGLVGLVTTFWMRTADALLIAGDVGLAGGHGGPSALCN